MVGLKFKLYMFSKYDSFFFPVVLIFGLVSSSVLHSLMVLR